jgi:23S rRNA (guanine2445-N2)-methyltransferase / 23S rRNA (guanine2069-N7)-methyltransferase
VVARELTLLGYLPRTTSTGRVEFLADPPAIARCNLWLRSADRLLLRAGRFPAPDFEALFELTRELPWERWIPRDARFPVSGRSVKSQLSSVPAVQRSVKKAVADRLLKAHRTTQLPETGALFPIEIALLQDQATLTLDTTGEGLHKRGYRDLAAPAPLRETLAAALVQLSFWDPQRPLMDPFCGSGTLCIEAALLARRLAPGLQRNFLAQDWPLVPTPLWRQARDEARAAALNSPLPLTIQGFDLDKNALTIAQRHARRAGVEDDLRFLHRPFDQTHSDQDWGCIITNPPYGVRLQDDQNLAPLYHSMPAVFRMLPSWSFFILTPWPDFEALLGRPADRRRKLYNAQIECTYYAFHGPKPHSITPKPNPDPSPQAPPDLNPSSPPEALRADKPAQPIPAFTTWRDKARDLARDFVNRLKRIDRHRRRWPTRGITCYRVYNHEIAAVPVTVDRFEDHALITEVRRPPDREPHEQAEWLSFLADQCAQALAVPLAHIHIRRRSPRDLPLGDLTRPHALTAHEAGLRYHLELGGHREPGLHLAHRLIREQVRQAAAGRRALDLFARTGAFSLNALAGGAASVLSIDRDPDDLDRLRAHLDLNRLDPARLHIERADPRTRLQPAAHHRAAFDLVVADLPTLGPRAADPEGPAPEHLSLPQIAHALAQLLAPRGVAWLLTWDTQPLPPSLLGCALTDATDRLTPEDFAGRPTPRAWRLDRP